MGEFRGFVVPTATPVPDQFFDELLPTLTLAETRVLLVIIRCTYGSRRPSADLSLRQIMEGVTDADGYPIAPPIGLSKATVCRALASLRRRRIIAAQRHRSNERGNEPTTYGLDSGIFL